VERGSKMYFLVSLSLGREARGEGLGTLK